MSRTSTSGGGGPASQAGTKAVQEQIGRLSRAGGVARIHAIVEELDTIAGQFEAGAVAAVRRCLTAALEAAGDTVPGPRPDGHAAAEAAAPAASGVSPYSTGGGGVTFERRVAATYLARLLTGVPAGELGEARRVTQVAFQQAPERAVDDLVIQAAHPDDPGDAAELLVAVRRAPKLADSDEKSEQLITQLLRVTTRRGEGADARTVAIAVAGTQSAASQLGFLVHHARNQSDADRFITLIETPGKFKGAMRTRLDQILRLVKKGLGTLDLPTDDPAVHRAAFGLLSELAVLQLRLEPPDETDWGVLAGQLMPAARGHTPQGAVHLRDRLEVLAAQYAPAAAEIGVRRLRRDVHDLIDSTYNRNARAWLLLSQLDSDWRGTIRTDIGALDGSGAHHLGRVGARDAVRSAIVASAAGVILHGQSGAGKSALVADALDGDSEEEQVLGLSLRQMPESPMELTARLGVPLADALGEMSAPRRVLVVDGADAAAESHAEMLAHVLTAARAADVTVVVVVAADALSSVRDITLRARGQIAEHEVSGLDDEDLGILIAAFPQLRRLAASPQARELLRRLAVADFLVRANTAGVPLSDADAMHEVWRSVVRRGGRSDRGQPDARERVLWQLARQQLDRERAETVLDTLDAAAVAGLRRDGLLRSASDQPWQRMPVFAHDLLRTYALAQLLLVDGRPGERLALCRAPRWALPAARLACQAILSTSADGSGGTLGQRFTELQRQFDQLVSRGYGDRWADVPAEALLTAGRDGATLSSAWPTITSAVRGAPQQILRLLGQRHRRSGVLDQLVAGPVVECLLDHGGSGADADAVVEAVREWQFALIAAGTSAGHPLRVRLREQLVQRCRDAVGKMAEEQRAREAKLASRTPEEAAADEERARSFPPVSGFISRRPHRARGQRQLPRELTDDAMLEQLALLGRDLGEEGAQLLRDVAEHAPHYLAPAVEEIGTGRALAEWSPELLRILTEAYYIDDPGDDDRFGFFGGIHDDGIRHHHWRGPVMPLAAYYRGPFVPMLQAGLRDGAAVINKMLNAGARRRVAQLIGLTSGTAQQEYLEHYETKLIIDGAERRFVGDDHVWSWYRGSTVGPSPCVSALQALELVCDQYIEAGALPAALVSLLLEGCENLAMVGLVAGILVRHAEEAGTALDPFFAEPEVWELEFFRVVNESSGLAAVTPGVVHADRRGWSLREAGMWLVVHADSARTEQLRLVGARLEQRARELIDRERPAAGDGGDLAAFEAAADKKMAAIRGWAATLDKGRYELEQRANGTVQIQLVPPDDVVEVLRSGNDDLARGGRATGLMMRYGNRSRTVSAGPIGTGELAEDIAAARELLADPPSAVPGAAGDAPAAVAAYAAEAALVHGEQVAADDLLWAANTLLAAAEHAWPRHPVENEFSLLSWGADRSAARGLPLLLLPQADGIRDELDLGGEQGHERLRRALYQLGVAAPLETRMFFASALDPLWLSPCTGRTCHHRVAVGIVEDSARDCVIGNWNAAKQRNDRPPLDGRVADTITAVPAEKIVVTCLSAAIRAAAPASLNGCCTQEAERLLAALLDAHRRGMTASKDQYMHSASDALVAARAVLTIAPADGGSGIYQHLTAYADHAAALGEFLLALAAAAEENPTLGAAARRLWPGVMNHMLDLLESGHDLRVQRSGGARALAALVPSTAYDAGYLRREIDGQPHPWAAVLDWTPEIERWLPYAAGAPECLDALIRALATAPVADQVRVGLAWMEKLVNADPASIAHRSWLLPQWLRDIRSGAHETAGPSWQRIVDALTVAGDSSVSDLTD